MVSYANRLIFCISLMRSVLYKFVDCFIFSGDVSSLPYTRKAGVYCMMEYDVVRYANAKVSRCISQVFVALTRTSSLLETVFHSGVLQTV